MTNIEALRQEAQTNIGLGRYPEAKRCLDQLLRADPTDVHGALLMGETLFYLRDFVAADRMFAPFTGNPEYAGYVACERSRIAVAETDLLAATADQRASGYIARRRGEAVQFAAMGLQANPSDWYSALVMSSALNCAGRTKEAIAEGRRAVGLTGNDPATRSQALANLSYVMVRQPSLAREALRLAEEARALDPHSEMATTALSVAQASGRDQANAMRTALEALRSAPTGVHQVKIAQFATHRLAMRVLGLSMFACVAINIAAGALWQNLGLSDEVLGRVGGALGFTALAGVAAWCLWPLFERSVRNAVWRFARGSVRAWIAVAALAGAMIINLIALAIGSRVFFGALAPILVGLVLYVAAGMVRGVLDRSN